MERESLDFIGMKAPGDYFLKREDVLKMFQDVL